MHISTSMSDTNCFVFLCFSLTLLYKFIFADEIFYQNIHLKNQVNSVPHPSNKYQSIVQPLFDIVNIHSEPPIQPAIKTPYSSDGEVLSMKSSQGILEWVKYPDPNNVTDQVMTSYLKSVISSDDTIASPMSFTPNRSPGENIKDNSTEIIPSKPAILFQIPAIYHHEKSNLFQLPSFEHASGIKENPLRHTQGSNFSRNNDYRALQREGRVQDNYAENDPEMDTYQQPAQIPVSTLQLELMQSDSSDYSDVSKEGYQDRSNEQRSEYENKAHKKHGYNKSNGYKSNREFSENSMGSFDDDEFKGFLEEDESKEASYHDDASEKEKHHKDDSGSYGIKSKDQSSHRKGSDKSGYHKVFHKDEIITDHIFYDEADHSGSYRKFGKSHMNHESIDKEQDKGYRLNSKHNEGLKKEHYKKDKGHFESKGSGFNREHGHTEEYENSDHMRKHGGSRIRQ